MSSAALVLLGETILRLSIGDGGQGRLVRLLPPAVFRGTSVAAASRLLSKSNVRPSLRLAGCCSQLGLLKAVVKG
jgi:hypothetical protein